jgi:hypothetical protein
LNIEQGTPIYKKFENGYAYIQCLITKPLQVYLNTVT